MFHGAVFDLRSRPGEEVAAFAIGYGRPVLNLPTLILEVGGVQFAQQAVQHGFFGRRSHGQFCFQQFDRLYKSFFFQLGDELSFIQQRLNGVRLVFIDACANKQGIYVAEGALEQALPLQAVDATPGICIIIGWDNGSAGGHDGFRR